MFVIESYAKKVLASECSKSLVRAPVGSNQGL